MSFLNKLVKRDKKAKKCCYTPQQINKSINSLANGINRTVKKLAKEPKL